MKETIRANDWAQRFADALPGGALLNSQAEKFDTMVIGWGHLGRLWNRQTIVVYVRESRYTLGQIDASGEFTVSVPLAGADPQITKICGTQSGRDIDKVTAAGLTPEAARTTHTPGLREYPLTFECRVLYRQKMDLSALPEEIRAQFYPQTEQGPDAHVVYVGEIVDAYLIRPDREDA